MNAKREGETLLPPKAKCEDSVLYHFPMLVVRFEGVWVGVDVLVVCHHPDVGNHDSDAYRMSSGEDVADERASGMNTGRRRD